MIMFMIGLFYLTSRVSQKLETGRGLIEDKKYEEAAVVFRGIVKEEPANAGAHYYLGLIAFNTDKLDEAIEMGEKAVELDEKNPAYHYSLGQYYVVKIDRVSFMAKLGVASKSKKAFEKAVALDPDNVTYRMSLMGYLANAPGIAGGDRDEARKQASEIMKRDKAMGVIASAMISRIDKKWDDARARYVEILELIKQGKVDDTYRSTVESGFNAVGYGYMGNNRMDDAVEIFKLNVKEFPRSYNTYDSLGEAYLKKGEKQLARQNYQKAMALNPRKSRVQKTGYNNARKTVEKLLK